MSVSALPCDLYSWKEICNVLSVDARWDSALALLTPQERTEGISRTRLWQLLDIGWHECKSTAPAGESRATFLSRYYQHPVWLLNGAFTESDLPSVSDRLAAVRMITHVNPKRVLDFGGGLGTTARLCAMHLPQIEYVDIVDISNERATLETRMSEFPAVHVRSTPRPPYDAIISTEVLEHLEDPIGTVAHLNSLCRVGGACALSYSFAPGILCHLPESFYLSQVMLWVIRSLGFGFYGFERRGSTVYSFVKTKDVTASDLRRARLVGALGKLPLVPWDRVLLFLRGM